MYSASLEYAVQTFSEYAEGRSDAPVFILSMHGASNEERQALESSCSALGYPSASCLFAQCAPEGKNALVPAQLLEFIEGIDPFRLIILDEESAQLCFEGYHRPLVLDEVVSLLDRPTAVFRSFGMLISSPEGKKTAWKLLKRCLAYSKQ